MKIFIKSCHASLEYDQARMFLGMGHMVAGAFDVGSVQRPKIEGCTDVTYDVEDALKTTDLLVLHQIEDYSHWFEQYAKQMGSRPVVLIQFGQGCDRQHKHVAQILVARKNTFVVSYSHKDHNNLIDLGAPPDKCRMIRFGKVISDFRDFGGWNGRLPICYMSCNALKRRGDGTAWPLAEQLIERAPFPFILSGKESLQHACGMGELSYETLKAMYRHCRCYLSLGTQPAPYVLTIVEAMCTGTPVVALNNGCGILDEHLGVLVVHNLAEMFTMVHALILDHGLASMHGERMRLIAEREFSMDRVAQQWNEFIEVMT